MMAIPGRHLSRVQALVGAAVLFAASLHAQELGRLSNGVQVRHKKAQVSAEAALLVVVEQGHGYENDSYQQVSSRTHQPAARRRMTTARRDVRRIVSDFLEERGGVAAPPGRARRLPVEVHHWVAATHALHPEGLAVVRRLAALWDVPANLTFSIRPPPVLIFGRTVGMGPSGRDRDGTRTSTVSFSQKVGIAKIREL